MISFQRSCQNAPGNAAFESYVDLHLRHAERLERHVGHGRQVLGVLPDALGLARGVLKYFRASAVNVPVGADSFSEGARASVRRTARLPTWRWSASTAAGPVARPRFGLRAPVRAWFPGWYKWPGTHRR
jgi:hypothetical protein